MAGSVRACEIWVCVCGYGRNGGVPKRGRRSALFVLVTGVCGYTNTDGDGVLFYVRVIRRIRTTTTVTTTMYYCTCIIVVLLRELELCSLYQREPVKGTDHVPGYFGT